MVLASFGLHRVVPASYDERAGPDSTAAARSHLKSLATPAMGPVWHGQCQVGNDRAVWLTAQSGWSNLWPHKGSSS